MITMNLSYNNLVTRNPEMNKPTLKSEGDITRGVILMLLSALMFALAGTAVKFAAQELSAFALVFWRNLLSFWLFLLLIYLKGFPDLKTSRIDLHLLRSLFTYGALLTYFFAISRIPLGSAVLLQSSGPVFVPLLALIFFRRMSDRNVWTGVVLAFAGVALIVQEGALGFSLGEISGVVCGFFGGCAALTIWAMSDGEPPLRQMFYFTLLTLVISILLLPWTWEVPSPPTFIPLAVLAVCTTLAQYFFSASLAASPADKVNTWSYASVIIAALIGYFLWREQLEAVAIAGMLLVVLGAHITSRKKAVPAT